jgi:tRNA pseudouridine38-40 synthase
VVEYDGTAYEGFQRQRGAPTIAGTLEDAARRIGAPEDPMLRVAGRTDAGVHAEGQVVALSVPAKFDARRLCLALNSNLPHDIRIRRAAPCTDDFDPRRDARRRTYVYRLCAGVPVPPLWRHMAAYYAQPMPLDAIAEALSCYLGQHDFRAWRSSTCEAKRTLLTIERAEILFPDPDAPVPRRHAEITIAARSFLHHMVRFLVGGAVAVARGRVTVAQLRECIARGERPREVMPAPACGLVLQRVDYAEGRDPFALASAAEARSSP